MRRQEFGVLVLLAAIWGVSFLLIDIAAPMLGPLPLVTARMLIATAALLVYARVTRRQRPSLRESWKAYLVLGLLNSALPLGLEAFAVLHVPASLVAILVTTAPLFTVLAATRWLGERLTPAKLAGLLLGLLGVGLLIGWSPLPLTIPVVLAVSAALLAALFYALGSIYAKVAFRGAPAVSRAIGQELLAGLVLLPPTLAHLPPALPSPVAIASTLVLALVMTAGGNLLYFYLLDHIGPTKTQSVALLIPVFALLASTAFLDEPVTRRNTGRAGHHSRERGAGHGGAPAAAARRAARHWYAAGAPRLGDAPRLGQHAYGAWAISRMVAGPCLGV